MKEFSTDLDRSEKSWKDYPKDDPEQTTDVKILALLVFSMLCFVGTIVLIVAGRNGFWDNI